MKSSIKTVFLAGIIAGILDGIAAVVILGKMNFSGVFKFVASGFFGKDAFAGGNEMVFYGILMHFTIAIVFAFLYYFSFFKLKFFQENKFIGGLAYGIFVWSIMNLILPFTNIPQRPFHWTGVVQGVLILMVCIGLPISLIINTIKNFYRENSYP